MKRCPTCGMLYSDMITVCPTCKVQLGGNPQPTPSATRPTPPPVQPQAPVQPQTPVQPDPPYNPAQPQVSVQSQASSSSYDKGGFLWYLPGLFIPLAGLILGLCVKKNKPNSAKAAYRGALIGFILGIALTSIGKFL